MPQLSDSGPPADLIKAADLCRLTRGAGRGYAMTPPAPGGGAALLQGRFRLYALRRGLSIHSTHLLALRELSTEIQLRPCLTISLVLDGHIDGALDGMPISHGQATPGCDAGPEPAAQPYSAGCLWSLTRPAQLQRRQRRGSLQRKVNISVDIEWLRESFCGLDEEWGAVVGFAERHLALRAWHPSPRAYWLGERILGLSDAPRFLEMMQAESAAIEIAAEAFRGLCGNALEDGRGLAMDGDVSARDLRRARRAREYIEARISQAIALSDIAREAGMSVSTLQRAFKAVTGTTVVEYLRRRKLEVARAALLHDGASIAEAAYLAGYTNPSNFTTAFKRAFGAPPSQLRG